MVELVAHPSSARGAVEGVGARALLQFDGSLAILYVLRAAMDCIAVPQPREPRRADGLWRHTCFECFVAGVGEGYSEFNFAPSGEWAAYAFTGYRRAESLPPGFEPHIAVKRAAFVLELRAVVPRASLPPRSAAHPWRIGLAAVVEHTTGDVSYWALRHAPGKPDFHHREAFALTL